MPTAQNLQILRAIIDIYVREGVPVSSRKIREATGIGLSTASIRNRMAELERSGYLMKPHTSAGRTPTDEGYRLYVSTLDSNLSYCEDFSTRLRDQLREQEMEVSTIMSSASRLLGSLSRNFSVVYGSVGRESRVSHVNLLRLEGNRLLVVVNLIPEYERTTVLRMDKPHFHDVIAQVEDWMNHAVSGKTMDEAKDALDAAVRDNMTDEGIIIREVAIHRENIFSEPPEVELYFEDRDHVLEQPELSDPKLLQLLLRLLHNKEYLTSVLSNRLEERTRITIGHENKDEALKRFSLVTAGYRIGVAHGVLGVIGPTRMRYDLVSDLVGAAAKELRALGEEFF
jgi:heat-inducible transcriptional repressor